MSRRFGDAPQARIFRAKVRVLARLERRPVVLLRLDECLVDTGVCHWLLLVLVVADAPGGAFRPVTSRAHQCELPLLYG